MPDTESQWAAALASNNIRAIIRWLRKLTAEGEVDVEEILPTFSCWVQRTSEFAKKELLTLCFSRCQGLWMFLDRSSFTRVHMLLQRLSNLLTLSKWARMHLSTVHFWHGVGVPCVVCGDTLGSPDIKHGCWNREHRALKQHIWLGRLVQWWGIMGLLPRSPEADKVKRISRMWKEMGHSYRKASLETPGYKEGEMERFRSLIQGMLTQLERQHGCIWTSDDCTDQCYPPPNLQALLKLVLLPHIDNMSVQAILMYFVMDMANFLQCKNDLLQSFCHAFTIPRSFSQQIRAFWMLDRGHIKASMELLLSPRAAVPRLSWQHRCILHCLLMRKQPHLALRYLHWTRPAIENVKDAKLCADVLLRNSCVSEAWALLKRGHTKSDDMVLHFLQACNELGLRTEALKYIPVGYNGEGYNVNGTETAGAQLPLMMKAGRPPCPLSATLYQAQQANAVCPEELLLLVRTAVMEVRKPHPRISEVVWTEHTEGKSNTREMFLSTQALGHLAPSPSPMDMVEETEQTAHTNDPEEEQPIHNLRVPTEHMSPSEDLSSESVSSFASASSLFLLGNGRPYVYKSTLTLQRKSSLITEGENQGEEEDDEEEGRGTPSPNDALPDDSKLMVPLDGATYPIFLSCNDLVELVLSAEGQMPCCKGVYEEEVHVPADVTDLWSSAVSFKQEDQSDCIPYELFGFSEAATPYCFLEEELSQKTYDLHRQEEAEIYFSQGFQSAMSDPHQNLPPDNPVAFGSSDSAGIFQDISSICSTQLQISGSSLTHSPTCNIETTSAPSDAANDGSSHKAQLTTGDPRVERTPSWLDLCTMGSWLNQDSQTHIASSGLLPATEPRVDITSDNKRPFLVPSQPYSYGPASSMCFSVKQKEDNTDAIQADKEEPAGWSSLGRGTQRAIRSGRTRSRKGKRVKRA